MAYPGPRSTWTFSSSHTRECRESAHRLKAAGFGTADLIGTEELLAHEITIFKDRAASTCKPERRDCLYGCLGATGGNEVRATVLGRIEGGVIRSKRAAAGASIWRTRGCWKRERRTQLDRQDAASLGFSMPAEWETHEATWLAWLITDGLADKLDIIRWSTRDGAQDFAGRANPHVGQLQKRRETSPDT